MQIPNPKKSCLKTCPKHSRLVHSFSKGLQKDSPAPSRYPPSAVPRADPEGPWRCAPAMSTDINQPESTVFCRVPINSIYGLILGSYKRIGSGWVRDVYTYDI